MILPVFLRLLWLVVLWFPTTMGQTSSRNSSTDLVSIYEPQLANLKYDPATFNPYLGGQNWTMCCALAVNASLVIDNETLYIRPGQTFFTGTIESLEAHPRFPCGATYNGSALNAPRQQFWIDYSWCQDRCPGWPVTKASNFDKWLKPMISFTLPSLIFCLNIPRRRRLDLPARLFSDKSLDLSNLFLFALKVPFASLVVTLDIIIWTCVSFSVAGPMLTSGIYEAILDARVLSFLDSRSKENLPTVQQKAHTLLSILIGNLDINAWHSSELFVQDLPTHVIGKRFGRSASADTLTPTEEQASISAPDWPLKASLPSTPSDSASTIRHGKIFRTEYQRRKTLAAKWRLRSMLDSQVSFGSSVGAPVLFYIGSFIWSVYEVEEDLGSYVTAHQLACGMFWMTIPHLALVSCLLLAGNNPNIWQGAISESFLQYDDPFFIQTQDLAHTDRDSGHGRIRGITRKPTFNSIRATKAINPSGSGIFDQFFGLAFKESKFKPAWMWNRGPNKAMWIHNLGEQYPYLRHMREDVLEKRFSRDLWASGLYGFILYFVPTLFGTIVSYTTPQTGFGCRSIIMLTYAASQLCLQILWILRCYFFHNGKNRALQDSGHTTTKPTWINYMWYSLFLLSAFMGALTSIGGTIFVLANVLTNCFCALPAKYWWDRFTNPNARIFVDDATYEQVYYANKWWFPAGIVGVVFMIIVAYIGWWYQRSLRQRFHDLVEGIDYVDELDTDGNGNFVSARSLDDV
ncbi:hypothetical protein F4821DRAFT_226394 [Hypoxylon rubiginosum]|uniref:Uncharacterized protein n=1 Tax=Hypoxylon rubiginosum TaxID=110542 RepID=A0ACC0DFR3_9PEZI|nr:hypothetical protein F4821DRAFT_226394 [Hypoxylon rubiginosum]